MRQATTPAPVWLIATARDGRTSETLASIVDVHLPVAPVRAATWMYGVPLTPKLPPAAKASPFAEMAPVVRIAVGVTGTPVRHDGVVAATATATLANVAAAAIMAVERYLVIDQVSARASRRAIGAGCTSVAEFS